MKYIRLFEGLEYQGEEGYILKKLYDYLIENGIENIKFSESIPRITNNITLSPDYPITFSITLSTDIYKDITITYLSPDRTNVLNIVFRYRDFEGVLDFLKDLELQYSANKYNI